MKTHYIASNLETKQLEWFTYDNHRLYKYNQTPVPMSAVELSAFYREKYSDDVKCKVFS